MFCNVWSMQWIVFTLPLPLNCVFSTWHNIYTYYNCTHAYIHTSPWVYMHNGIIEHVPHYLDHVYLLASGRWYLGALRTVWEGLICVKPSIAITIIIIIYYSPAYKYTLALSYCVYHRALDHACLLVSCCSSLTDQGTQEGQGHHPTYSVCLSCRHVGQWASDLCQQLHVLQEPRHICLSTCIIVSINGCSIIVLIYLMYCVHTATVSQLCTEYMSVLRVQ